MLKRILNKYSLLPKRIHSLIAVQFFLNIIHVAFVLILNIYLRKKGFSDPQIANYNSLRFLGVLMFALPFGIFIKSRNLKPFFILSSFLVPSFSLVLINAIDKNLELLIPFGFFGWGISMMLMNVCSLPFILRNTNNKNSIESLSLSFSTWSLAMMFSGLIISGLQSIGDLKIFHLIFYFNEYTLLTIISLLSFLSLPFSVSINEKHSSKTDRINYNSFSSIVESYDWHLILKAITPNVAISIGAGLTIPFINLFFNSIFQLDSDSFSLLGSITSFIVFVTALFVPTIKNKFGYWVSIVFVQSCSIVCLLTLAFTEIFSTNDLSLSIAILAYVFRQPLMHMAHPSANELTMNYVGEKNQELISALNSSLWSASWFISAKLFQFLRENGFEYYKIFFITSLLYVIGTIFYGMIILSFNKKKEARLQNKEQILTLDNID